MLVRREAGGLTIFLDGQPIQARAGDSVATALLAACVSITRTTPGSGAARGPFCLMGACFECLAVVDGQPNVQACMTPVRDGMRIGLQHGARTIGSTEDSPPATDVAEA